MKVNTVFHRLAASIGVCAALSSCFLLPQVSARTARLRRHPSTAGGSRLPKAAPTSSPQPGTEVTGETTPNPAKPKAAVTKAAPPKPVKEVTSPLWPSYDEIQLVVAKDIMPPRAGYFAPADPLLAGVFLDSLKQLQKQYIWRGMTPLPALPQVTSRSQPLSRQQAVDLLVKALLPAAKTPTWDAATVTTAILDYGQVEPQYQKSVALAAEQMFLPNPLRPGDAADRAFGASILARAYPWTTAVPASGPLRDEIRKALSMHLFFSAGAFPETQTLTAAALARAISRAQRFMPPNQWALLPQMPVDSTDRHPLTRAQAIAMVVQGMVIDYRFNPRLASDGAAMVDPDARVVMAMGPPMYLSRLDDANTIPDTYRNAVAVGTYKGLLPNLSTEPGQLKPNQEVTMGYAADLLARSVTKPGDYTGIILDMSQLKPLERAGGMWIINAGDSTDSAVPPVTVYPSGSHLPVRPFFAAPGALAYYGSIDGAELGRAGRNPLIIHPLDWARYDWSNLHGDPGLRRGGGKEVSLAKYNFVHGTPPLILLSPEDAQKLQDLDRQDLLLRTARVALVQPNWSMTAMRQ